MRIPRPSGPPAILRSRSRLLPHPCSKCPDTENALSGALLLVHDPERRPRPDPEILRHAFGLSKGAAKLVAALAADDDLKRHAERENITIHTARFHLRAALSQTGTRTQAQLVRPRGAAAYRNTYARMFEAPSSK